MTNKTSYSLLTGLLILGGVIWLHTLSSASPAVQPVTIVYQRTIFPKETSTNVGFVRTETLGVRSDGSVSRADLKVATPTHPAYNTLLITDVPSGRHIIVDQLTQSTTTYTSQGIVRQHQVRPATSCLGNAGDRILGFDTFVEEKTLGFPDRKVVYKYWRAPNLNCLPLREEHRDSRSNGKTSLQVLSATTVTLGAPPTWMFEVPPGYTERTPNEVFAEAAKRSGRNLLPFNQRLEEVYEEGHKTNNNP